MNPESMNTLKLFHEQMAKHIEMYRSATQEDADEFILNSIRFELNFLREDIQRLEHQLFDEFNKKSYH